MKTLLLLTLLSLPTLLHAEPTMPSEDKARQCFNRGVELYDERNLEGADVEFRRAYELAPNFHLLYNLGQVASERHDYATAMDFFQRYLREGGNKVSADRKFAVETELDKFRTRVGQLAIRWEGSPALVVIDDETKGKTPLSQPIEVNVGRRRIELRTFDGESQSRMVDVTGGDTVVVTFLDNPLPKNTKANSTNHVQGAAQAATPRRSGTIILWTGAAFTAAGATIASIMAHNFAKDLSNQRRSYPVSRDDLDQNQKRVHYASWTADGLIATTVVLTAIAIFHGGGAGGKKPSATAVSVGSNGPWSLQLSQAF